MLDEAATALDGREQDLRELTQDLDLFAEQVLEHEDSFRSLLETAPPVLDSVTSVSPELQSALEDTATITQPGLALGTPAYAAPETVAHGDRSAAADVYSLAATLHELLTGSRWNSTVGATQAMPAGDWARVLAPALSNDPSRRPSAAGLAASLTALDGHGGAPATTPMVVPVASTARRTAATGPGDDRGVDQEAVARQRVHVGAGVDLLGERRPAAQGDRDEEGDEGRAHRRLRGGRAARPAARRGRPGTRPRG